MVADALIPRGFSRYVALGDSFTEGVGDPDPTRPNGVRGWADRVAEALAQGAASAGTDFGYANLAIRGRKLHEILEEQIDPALALRPDLVSIHGGGNDMLRPSVDVDALAEEYDAAVSRLAASGAQVVMFTIADPGLNPVLKLVRGRTAVFNEWVREIAENHGACVVDMWRIRGWKVSEVLDADRLHLNSVGHQAIAIAVLEALRMRHELRPLDVVPAPELTRREQRRENWEWARDHLAPWVKRRLTGRSSGDSISPKYPTLTRLPLSPSARLSEPR